MTDQKKLAKKRYREANKEKCAASQKAWREANKEKRAASQKAWREANKERKSEVRHARYVAKAEELKEKERQRRIDRKEFIKEGKRRWYENRKKEVMDHYGGATCTLCPENRIRALHLDHINGGGKAHYKEVMKGKVDARWLYKWVINNNYPDGFRVLCANCNWLGHLQSLPPPSENTVAKRTRTIQHNLKLKLMGMLGGVCVECKAHDIRILTVNHTNNDGAEHRKRLSRGKGGSVFYRAVLKLGDLSGLECKCFSCNDAGFR